MVDLEQLESLGLPRSAIVAGAELGEGDEAILRLAVSAREAEKRGLALLARAEQSGFMLRGKLEARGFPDRAVKLALERLAAQGWLDDRRFARAYAASRLAHRPEGPASLLAALRGRGVDQELAQAAVDELLDPETRLAALGRAFEKELKRAHGDLKAARLKMRSLGFGAFELSAYIEERQAPSRGDE